ncbi:hypothetical protein ACFW04_007453 [Cataglyphis niger]
MITAFLEQDLISSDSHRNWDLHLAEFRFPYNLAYHTSLQATPAFLNFGRESSAINSRREVQEPELEIAEAATGKWKKHMEQIQALRDWVIENLEAAHQKQSRYYNLCRRDVRFVIGDKILKRQHVLSSAAHAISAKLAAKYHRPFIISKILSPVYELADKEKQMVGKIHVEDLKSYVSSNP